jgi:glycerol-3-phosphate dehydrogenase (NAD(P)+)
LLLCSKGIEAGTMALMSEVAAETCPDAPVAVLSGPTFASEVAKGLPTAVTLACADEALAGGWPNASPPRLPPLSLDRCDRRRDRRRVKNVLAIACGVVEGAGLGRNARAALIARGFAEMTRFGMARGARPETLAGLSGLGDLVLTCSSEQSRNFSLGLGLGRARRQSPAVRSPHGRGGRLHRAGAGGGGEGRRCRDADFGSGRRLGVR